MTVTKRARATFRPVVVFLVAGIIPSCGGPSADCEGLKYLAGSALNYRDTHGRFPPPVVFDRDGRRMHSWRVLLLPYVQATAFAAAYDFESPWDSPANAKVAAGGVIRELLEGPRGYAYPNAKAYPAEARRAYKTRPNEVAAGDFTTDFLMVVRGDQPLVPSDSPTVRPEGEKWRAAAPADEVLIVQVRKSAVHWTEPRDVVLASPAPEWGVPLAAVEADVLGSVQVTDGRVTCRGREATLTLLAERAAKAAAPPEATEPSR